MYPTLVIITGNSATGKTSVGRQLSGQYHIPLISKDALKERIFDNLATGDKEWSRKVSAVAHRIMDDMVDELLAAGQSVIVESNFKQDIDSQRFAAIIQKHQAKCVQILCTAPGPVLFKRWNARIADDKRHGGHVEAVSLDQIQRDLASPYPPLDLPDELIEIDTSDFSTVELPKLTLG